MFIIDFDDTLFNTQAFKQARLEAVRAYKVTNEDFWTTYRKARGNDDELLNYTDEHHAQLLAQRGHDYQTILAALQSVNQQISEFVFPDAIPFLQSAKSSGQRMILISRGNSAFQQMKIQTSGVAPFFDEIISLEHGKNDILRTLLAAKQPDERIWFINDKIKETQAVAREFPEIIPVLKVSPLFPPEAYAASTMPYFATLNNIKQYVQQTHI